MQTDRKPTKRKGEDKRACEIRAEFICTDIGTQRYQGLMQGKPKFKACIECSAWLTRIGAKYKPL